MLSVLPLVELLPLGLVHFRSRFMQSAIILKLIFVYFNFFLCVGKQKSFFGLSTKMALYLCSASCSDGLINFLGNFPNEI